MKIQVTIGFSAELKEFLSELITGSVPAGNKLKAVPLEIEGTSEETKTDKPGPGRKKKTVTTDEGSIDMGDLLGENKPAAKKATTIEDVRSKLNPIINSGKDGFNKVQQALKSIGVDSLLKCPPEKFDDLIKAVLG